MTLALVVARRGRGGRRRRTARSSAARWFCRGLRAAGRAGHAGARRSRDDRGRPRRAGSWPWPRCIAARRRRLRSRPEQLEAQGHLLARVRGRRQPARRWSPPSGRPWLTGSRPSTPRCATLGCAPGRAAAAWTGCATSTGPTATRRSPGTAPPGSPARPTTCGPDGRVQVGAALRDRHDLVRARPRRGHAWLDDDPRRRLVRPSTTSAHSGSPAPQLAVVVTVTQGYYRTRF